MRWLDDLVQRQDFSRQLYTEVDPDKLWVVRRPSYKKLVSAWKIEYGRKRRYVLAPSMFVITDDPGSISVTTVDQFYGVEWYLSFTQPMALVVCLHNAMSVHRVIVHSVLISRSHTIELYDRPCLVPARQASEALELAARAEREWTNIIREPDTLDPSPAELVQHLPRLIERTENLRRLADAAAVS